MKNDVCNKDIRDILANRNLKHYQVAAECGVTKYTFSVWLSIPLNDKRKERILDAVNRLIKSKAE
jgi:hypothetical protein